MTTTNGIPSEIFFLKKEIDRLNIEIQQYQTENLSLKKEIQRTPTNLKEQIKDIIGNQDAEVCTLKELLNEKDQQIESLKLKYVEHLNAANVLNERICEVTNSYEETIETLKKTAKYKENTYASEITNLKLALKAKTDQVEDMGKNHAKEITSLKLEQINKLQITIKDKEDQITVLHNKINILEEEKNELLKGKEGFKEERKLLSISIEACKSESVKLKEENELKTKQIEALKQQFDKYLSELTTTTSKGRKSKKDLAFQDILESKEKEIANLKGFIEALKLSLKDTSDKLNYKEAEGKLLRGKFIQAANYCTELSEKSTDNVQEIFIKLSNFCKSVANSEIAKKA